MERCAEAAKARSPSFCALEGTGTQGGGGGGVRPCDRAAPPSFEWASTSAERLRACSRRCVLCVCVAVCVVVFAVRACVRASCFGRRRRRQEAMLALHAGLACWPCMLASADDVLSSLAGRTAAETAWPAPRWKPVAISHVCASMCTGYPPSPINRRDRPAASVCGSCQRCAGHADLDS